MVCNVAHKENNINRIMQELQCNIMQCLFILLRIIITISIELHYILYYKTRKGLTKAKLLCVEWDFLIAYSEDLKIQF